MWLLVFFTIISLLCLSPTPVRADTVWTRHTIDGSFDGADGVRLYDVNGDGYKDITSGFEEDGVVKVYINPGPSNVSGEWQNSIVGFPGTPEDAVFADLDSNGQYDVITSGQGSERIYIHWAPNSFADYLTLSAWSTQAITNSVGVTPWIYSVPYQLDGQNGVDIISGASNFSGDADNSQIAWFESPANPRNISDWEIHKISDNAWTMALMMSDMDGDEDADVYTSDREGARWLENPGPGVAQENEWENHQIMTGDTRFGSLGDLDEDGLDDAINVVSGATDTIVYSRRLDSTGDSWQNYTITWPTEAGVEPKGIKIADVDHDGNNDLVVSSVFSAGKQGVFWLSYPSSPTDTTWDFHEISGVDGGDKFDDVVLYDVDDDNDLDVFSTEENSDLGVLWYENPFGPFPDDESDEDSSTPTSSSVASAANTPALPPNCKAKPPGEKTPWLYGAVPQDSNSILLQFGAAGGAFDHYAVEYGTKPGQYTWSASNIGDRDTRTYLAQSLKPNTRYYFRIRAGNGCAPGGWSNEIAATTTAFGLLNQIKIAESNLETLASDMSEESSEQQESEEVGGYVVRIKVLDQENNIVVGSKVIMHSKVQEAFTDEEGVVEFRDVEPGDHRVIVAQNGAEGEQSLHLSGDVKQFNLEITVDKTNTIFIPRMTAMIVAVGGISICAVLAFRWYGLRIKDT